MANKEICETCRFAVREDPADEGYICYNDDSIFVCDYMDGDYGCERWEGEDDE